MDDNIFEETELSDSGVFSNSTKDNSPKSKTNSQDSLSTQSNPIIKETNSIQQNSTTPATPSHKDMPSKMAVQKNLTRLGIIFSNYTIIGILFLVSSFMFFVFEILYFLALILFVLLTLGFVFMYIPNYGSLFDASEHFDGILNFINSTLPIVAPLTLFFAIASLVLLCLDKGNRNVPRIVFSSILIGIIAVIIIALLLGARG